MDHNSDGQLQDKQIVEFNVSNSTIVNPLAQVHTPHQAIQDFEQSGRLDDLEEAISLHRVAIKLRPAPHSDRSASLDNLALALQSRFELSGRRDDLDEAILLHRDALDLRPGSHPDRSMSLNNVAGSLLTRFQQSGRRGDLEEAVSLYRDALELRPASHPGRSISSSNLASALQTCYEKSSRHSDLEEAVSLHRDALKWLSASNPDQSMFLNNFALALSKQFERSGRQDDLEEAISLHRDALELQPASHPDRFMTLSNLASVLSTKFEQSHQHEDLKEAIDLSYQSLNALVSGHPLTSLHSRIQGNVFFVAYAHTQESEYLHKAMDAFKTAVTCDTAPASLRFLCAKEWASLADSRHDSALDAYHAAIQLLPQLAMLGLDLPSRQQALTSGSDGLARNAAACAIRSGQYGKAVELLEEGRAVFWSQALQLRTPMSDLRGVAPELEEKLRCISLALERGSLRNISRSMSDNAQKVMSIEQEASHFRRLSDEWLAILEEIRQLDGFEDFLRPRRLSTLLYATTQVPVVILNASNTGCDALILTSTGVYHVPLVLTFAHVTRLVKLIKLAIASSSQDPSYSEPIRVHVEYLLRQMPHLSNTLQLLRQALESRVMIRPSVYGQSDKIFRYVLAMLWESVVKPVVCLLDLEKTVTPPNLWWCPTGPFAFLPIHAAGIYNTEHPECASDYVTSSYTPSISALLRGIPHPPKPFKMMVVIQPETLPYTIDELRQIKTHVPMKELITLVSGTVEEVISHLPAILIAQFACHGKQHIQNPLESALILCDGPLMVSQIMQQSMPNATLAFLSACQIADTFYEYLFRENNSTITDTYQPNTTYSAQALHLAVAKLHSEGVSFARWVPFIHLGM